MNTRCDRDQYTTMHGYACKIVIVIMIHVHFVLSTSDWLQGLDCYYKRGVISIKGSEYWSVTRDGYKDWAHWDLYGKVPCWRVISDKDIPSLCQDASSEECLAKKECAYFFHSSPSNLCESLRVMVDQGNMTASQRNSVTEIVWQA